MQDTTSGVSPVASGSENTQAQDQSYSKEFVEKVLKEKKNTAAKAEELARQANELKAKLEEYENKKLEEQGRYQELLQAEREKLKAKDQEYSVLKTTIIQDRVKSTISSEAAKLGCVDLDALIKVGDLSKITPNPQTLEVDANEVKGFVNEMLASKPYLFQQAAPKINDLPVTTGPGATTDISKLSREDLMSLLAKAK